MWVRNMQKPVFYSGSAVSDRRNGNNASRVFRGRRYCCTKYYLRCCKISLYSGSTM